jgi:hypothetical protein
MRLHLVGALRNELFHELLNHDFSKIAPYEIDQELGAKRYKDGHVTVDIDDTVVLIRFTVKKIRLNGNYQATIQLGRNEIATLMRLVFAKEQFGAVIAELSRTLTSTE